MLNISVFNFEQNSQIRIVMINDNPWFVAKDICDALFIKNPTDALKSLDQDERSRFNLGRSKTTGGGGEVNIINESGMYALVMRSRDAMKAGTPQHKFRKWVTSEVLPTIRKTGKYAVTDQVQSEPLTNNDIENIKRMIWWCAGHLDREQAFSNAIWYSLRQVTGVKSQDKFEARHLPIMAQEFQRIFNIVEPYIHKRLECEKTLVKRLLRSREHSNGILESIFEDMDQAAKGFNQGIQDKFPKLFSIDCQHLINRGARRLTASM